MKAVHSHAPNFMDAASKHHHHHHGGHGADGHTCSSDFNRAPWSSRSKPKFVKS